MTLRTLLSLSVSTALTLVAFAGSAAAQSYKTSSGVKGETVTKALNTATFGWTSGGSGGSNGKGGGNGTWGTPPPPDDVDLALMATHVQWMMRYKVVGFSALIAEDGKIARQVNWGASKRGPKDPDEKWTNDTRMQVASVSKTLSAIATIKLLDALQLSPDTVVWPFLPSDWDLGAGWKSLRFRHLLTHTSGINQAINALGSQPGNTWSGLQTVVGLDINVGSSSQYKNANFALLRVLVPRLGSLLPGSPIEGSPVVETNHGGLHVMMMQDLVFEPAGVFNTGCWETGVAPTAYLYHLDKPTMAGDPGEYTLSGCGAHAGWHLSTTELSAVLAYLRHDDNYMPLALRLMMNSERYGWNRSSNTSGSENMYWHGGDISMGGGESHACAMTFPGNVEASILFNSNHADGISPCGVLKRAYERARDGIAAPTNYPDCKDPSAASLLGTPGCPCADIVPLNDMSGDGGQADGEGSYLEHGLYGTGQYCAGANTVCGLKQVHKSTLPQCMECGVDTNIGCPCDRHAQCDGLDGDLQCWGLEEDGWGPSEGGTCLPVTHHAAGREKLEEMPWFCLDNCGAIDAYDDGSVVCAFKQTDLDFPHGECVDLLSNCSGMQPGECEESGDSCNFNDVCEQECQTQQDCVSQGFPDWYECDANGDVTFSPAHCVPPECTDASSAYCALYR